LEKLEETDAAGGPDGQEEVEGPVGQEEVKGPAG